MRERVHVATASDATIYGLRASTQRWPRAGVKPVYTIRCPDCGRRHRLSFSYYWLTDRNGSGRFVWGFACRRQFTFDDEALPEAV